MPSHGRPASEFDIVQLIYCSEVANYGCDLEFERGLRGILGHSLAYNPLRDITGVLMTDGRRFAHVVEGPQAAVSQLYSRIMRDKRHNRVMTLQHAVVHVRLFGAWPAAFLRVGTMTHVAALSARSTPTELRKASGSVLMASRPILLR